MKRLLLPATLTLWALLPTAQAQTPFGLAYHNADGSGKLIALENGKTLVNIGRGPALTLLDSLGELIWTQWKWGNGAQPIYYPLSVAKLSESSFYSVGGYQSSGFQPVLCRLDSSGDILEAKRYVIGNTLMSFAKDLTVTSDGGAVIWSRPWFPGFFILKTQQDLSHQWSHFYGSTGSFQFVKELPGGDLLAGINMDTAGAVVARIDANGNMLWCNSYFRPRGVVQDAVADSDSSFIITGYSDSTYNNKLFLMKLNGSGEVQWCKGYAGPELGYASQGQKTAGDSDNGYVLLAQSDAIPVLLKVDVNGDTLWTRTIQSSGYNYDLLDMIKREDGGYMMSMGAFGNGVNGPILMKTDSLGHFPCGYQSYPVQVMDIFPVDSAFILAPTSSGALAYPVTFRDTIFDPITAYDLCGIVTTVPEPIRPSRATVHPNPNTGRFTVEFNDPLTVDSFYSVYDAVGKLLLQRPLAKGQESEEIDLSRFAKGTYLVRVTSRDGVCNERVVVQ